MGTDDQVAVAQVLALVRRAWESAGSPSFRSLSLETGYSHTTIAHLINGDRLPKWEVVDKVLAALGVDSRSAKETYDSTRAPLVPSEGFAYKRMLKMYCEALEVVTSSLSVPSMYEVDRRPLYSLYAQPSVRPLTSDKELETFELSALLKRDRRIILLGSPGVGKSSACIYLARQVMSEQLADAVPIIIVVREHPGIGFHSSILDVIRSTLRQRFQIEGDSGFLPWLLTHRAVTLFVDGLDEVLDASARVQLVAALEAFAAVNPTVQMVVTSRLVGYATSPLSEALFKVYLLQPLNDHQATELIQKYFRSLEAIEDAQADKLAKQFIEESFRFRDLTSNPLLLTTMLTLYRRIGSLPLNRVRLIGETFHLLVDSWDRRRGLHIPLDADAHLEGLLSAVALKVIRDHKYEYVPRAYVVEAISEYLFEWQFGNHELAQRAAEQVLDFLKGRAGMFTDVGVDASGRELWSFTHRTFLEFAAARGLVRTSNTPENLAVQLLPFFDSAIEYSVVEFALGLSDTVWRNGSAVAVEYLLHQTAGGEEHESDSANKFIRKLAATQAPRTAH